MRPEDWLIRAYDRDRVRYVIAGISTLIVTVLALAGVSVLVFGRYENLSDDELRTYVLVTGSAVTLATALMAFLLRDIGLGAFHWIRNQNPATAAATWELGRQLQYRLPRAALVYPLLVIPAAVVTSATIGLPAFDTTLIAVYAALACFAAYVFCQFLVELFARPAVIEVASQLPAPITADDRAQSLSTKIILGLTALAVLAGLFATLLLTDSSAPHSETLENLALTIGLFAAVLLPFSFVVARTIVSQVADLAAGAEAVLAGELDTSIPVASFDELGMLAASFNRMVVGLREREELRGRNEELVTELQGSLNRITAASDEGRRRVERDLHDGAQQTLVLLNLKLGLAERQLAEDPAPPPASSPRHVPTLSAHSTSSATSPTASTRRS